MPDDLAKLVQEAADADRRSKSDWIVLQLEAIFTKRARSARRTSERRVEPSWSLRDQRRGSRRQFRRDSGDPSRTRTCDLRFRKAPL
jgi:hypothetical protein